MKSLWTKDFKAQSVDTPKEIIATQCESLEQITKGSILAKITEYDGPIHTYLIESPLQASMKSFEVKKVDIQEALGEISESNFVYEFFITSRETPNFKYRVMFLSYGISFYPVTVVLDEAIANEIGLKDNNQFNTQEEFVGALNSILNSSKMENVITALLAIVKKEDEKFTF